MLLAACGGARFAAAPSGEGAEASRPDAAGDDAGISSADAPTDARSEARDGPASCKEADAGVFGGHCYFLFAPSTQPVAKAACQAAGAHLATLTTSAENTFASQAFPLDAWIGLEATPPSNVETDFR
jgi:hypothetical protein